MEVTLGTVRPATRNFCIRIFRLLASFRAPFRVSLVRSSSPVSTICSTLRTIGWTLGTSSRREFV